LIFIILQSRTLANTLNWRSHVYKGALQQSALKFMTKIVFYIYRSKLSFIMTK